MGTLTQPCDARGQGGSAPEASFLPPLLPSSGDTYFFKGAHYWRFPKGSVKVEPDFPQPMGPQWLDCPASTSDPHVPKPPQATPRSRACDCKCEINRAAGRLPDPLLLPLLPLLAGAVASR